MKYIILGMGLSGKGASELLESKKIEYIKVDKKTELSEIEAIKLIEKDDIVVKSPGIPWTNELLVYCNENNIKVISEIDLANSFVNKNTKIIAITGTNGKTTIVTKTYELLSYMGYSVSLGGNEGHSFSSIISKKNDYDYIVLELSSYQLENRPTIKPYISLISNLTPDHLLRYSSIEEYYKTKFNIFNNQDENDYMIINKENIEFDKIYKQKDYKAKKVYMNDNASFLNFDTELKGEHNRENMLNIVAIARILDISYEKIKEFLSQTKTLEHRMERFLKKDALLFINDSKGTNVESTLFAIKAYLGTKLVLICGGQDKKIDNSKLYDIIIKNNIFTMLIGENASQYIETFNKENYTNYINLETLDKCVEYIKENIKEANILLSPATASFDQFKSFEHRGEVFKKLVNNTFGEENGN